MNEKKITRASLQKKKLTNMEFLAPCTKFGSCEDFFFFPIEREREREMRIVNKSGKILIEELQVTS